MWISCADLEQQTQASNARKESYLRPRVSLSALAILQPESTVANHYGHGLGRAAFIALHMTLALVCLATERTQTDAAKQRLVLNLMCNYLSIKKLTVGSTRKV